MKQNIILATLIILFITSCKRDHTCMCPAPLIDQTGFIIHDTKSNAEKKCRETKNPFNESECTLYK